MNHFCDIQNEDGGWGLHAEGHSNMFCTALNYICMRILGEGPDGGQENSCAKARKWILDHGGVSYIPSWGKTWLSVSLRLLLNIKKLPCKFCKHTLRLVQQGERELIYIKAPRFET